MQGLSAALPAAAALAASGLLASRPGSGPGASAGDGTTVAAVAAVVLARCLWALGAEASAAMRGRRGDDAVEEKRAGREALGMGRPRGGENDGLGTALALAQTAAWATATHFVGPLRAGMLVLLPACAAAAFVPGARQQQQASQTRRAAAAGVLAAALALYTAYTDEAGATALAALGAVSAALARLPRRRADGWATPVLAAGAVGAAVVLLLSPWMSLAPGPFAAMAITAAYLPLHSLSSLTPPSAWSLAHVALAQVFAVPPRPAWTDVGALAPTLFLARVPAPAPAPGLKGWSFQRAASAAAVPSVSTGPFFSLNTPLSLLPPAWRPHVLTAVRTPASRRIFGFLLLNLAYMGVQMGYGIATNSLGLISDAIHMLFDCLSLAVGLWAAVAATWKPDGQYTFGYARVETLSGCFLILISVFIIFEAIQRVINPPEMETQQLLLVSSVGLAINLFGMWATGGHHHHGHGHSHGHSHDHGHGHDHGHDHAHGHDHGHDQDHAHAHAHDNDHTNGNGHGHGHGHEKGSNGGSGCGHDHNHSHAHAHTHTPADSKDHDHGHDHGHSHNMRGVFLHVMADTLGSVGVIVSTLLIRWTGWTGFDPLASIFIAALILASVLPLVTDAARVLVLDVGKESEPGIRAALADVAAIDGVRSYAATRVWPREHADLVASLHVHLAPGADIARTSARVDAAMRARIRGLSELVVQIEGDDRFCSCMTK